MRTAPATAVAYGAFDLGTADGDSPRIALLPTQPSQPIIIEGDVARAWLSLAELPCDYTNRSANEFTLESEFVEAGIASTAIGTGQANFLSLQAPTYASLVHEFVYALLASLCADLGIDYVFIKGEALHHQGLRERRHSGDVDIWINRRDTALLTAALAKWGWERKAEFWEGTPVIHSVTVRPGDWGCEIYIHHTMPGIALDGSSALSIIRQTAVRRQYGGIMGYHPDRGMHAVLYALHAARPSIGSKGDTSRINTAAEILRNGGPDAYAAILKIKATAALREPLAIAFPDADDVPDHDMPLDWVWRGQGSKLRAYLSAARMVPRKDRARVLWRAFWPGRDLVLESDRRAGKRSRNAYSAQAKRLFRGVRGIVTRN